MEDNSFYGKFTAKRLMGDCPYAVALETIKTSLWDVPATEDADKAHTTTWVAKMVHDYDVTMAWDDFLFDDYLVDFEGWTKDMFLRVERNTLKSLKTVLRYRGVYTGNNRAKLADSFYKMLSMENTPEWDTEEFKTANFDKRSKAYQNQQDIKHTIHVTAQQTLPTNLPADTQSPQPVPLTETQMRQSQQSQQAEPHRVGQDTQRRPQTMEPQPVYQTREPRLSELQDINRQQPPYMDKQFRGRQPQQRWEPDTQPQQWHLQTQTRPSATAYREITPFPQQPTNGVPNRPRETQHDPYKTLPPRWSRNERLSANTITQFSKIWENSKRYTGDVYDLLDDKMKIFFSICWQLDIQEDQFHAVFPRILTGRAEMFYIQVVERDDSFAAAYTANKNE